MPGLDVESVKLWGQIIGSAMTLGSLWFMGRGSWVGPALGALGFIPWTAFALATGGAWVFVAQNCVFTALHLWNLRPGAVCSPFTKAAHVPA